MIYLLYSAAPCVLHTIKPRFLLFDDAKNGAGAYWVILVTVGSGSCPIFLVGSLQIKPASQSPLLSDLCCPLFHSLSVLLSPS